MRTWYVIKTKSGFTSFIEAETSKQARKLYSEIYYGEIVSARKATNKDWNRNETLWLDSPKGRSPKRSRVLRGKVHA